MGSSCGCFAKGVAAPRVAQLPQPEAKPVIAAPPELVAEEPSSSAPKKERPAWVTGLKNSAVDPSDTCRYYCPLCMLFYECVYETKCCGHTLCDECVLSFLETSGGQLKTATEGSGEEEEDRVPLTPNCTSSLMLPVSCPFCRHEDGLALKLITPGEAGEHLRSYEDSPLRLSRHGTPSSALRRSGGLTGPSPLRVGDSFEKMKAKMIPLDESRAIPADINPVDSRTPGAARPPKPPNSSVQGESSRQPEPAQSASLAPVPMALTPVPDEPRALPHTVAELNLNAIDDRAAGDSGEAAITEVSQPATIEKPNNEELAQEATSASADDTAPVPDMGSAQEVEAQEESPSPGDGIAAVNSETTPIRESAIVTASTPIGDTGRIEHEMQNMQVVQAAA